MPVLRALKSFSYDKVRLKAGDLFNCDDRDVLIVVHGRLATMPEVEIAKPTQVYQTRHLEAAKTVNQLREEATAKGIHLPSGYVPKAELQRIIAQG